MSSIITGFAALSNQSSDLLNPIEHRTIVEMIRGILNSYQFKKLDGAVKLFYQHFNSKDPLYLASGVNFYQKVIENTYTVYTKMTPTPLSLADFKTQIAPTLGFVELFRRIVMNRFLYDQLKAVNGSIPAGTYNVYLSSEWRLSEAYPNPVSLTFPSLIANETDFLKLGWTGNTTPVATIHTAEFLTTSQVNLPIIFSTSSDVVATLDPSLPATIASVSNDLTLNINYTGTPSSLTTLVTLTNGTDVIKVNLTTDRKMSVLFNNVKVAETNVRSSDGRSSLVIDSRGYVTLRVSNEVAQVRVTGKFILKSTIPFSTMMVNAPYINPFTTNFGIRSVTVHQGFDDTVTADVIVVPPGYCLLVDTNGDYLTDPDGVPLMDVDVQPGADVEGNFTYIVDTDGSFLMDRDGNYLVVQADNYYAIVDNDGTPLIDDDGSLIVEPE